jgi:uroporphyrinogen-III decarboxylase
MEILKRWNLASVSQQCAESPRFVLANCEGSMFQRLCWLRSRSAAVGDLRKDSKPVRKLLAMLHEFCCREVELWCGSDVDAIALHDAWWTEQPSIDVQIWRNVFKPIYREYCAMIRKADKFVFFDVQGPCLEVLPDLVEIGVDAIGADWLSMPLEQLAPEYRDKVTFWVGVGGRESVGQLTPDQAREAVRRLRRVLDGSHGGIIARYVWAPGTEFKNMVTFYEHWLEPASALAAATQGQPGDGTQESRSSSDAGTAAASKT